MPGKVRLKMTRIVLAVLLISLVSAGAQPKQEAEKDPHRPSCTSARCRKIESFLEAHYCGESPFGNGPDDGCEIKRPKTPRASVKVLANFDCKWIEGTSRCQQHVPPSAEGRAILLREMRKLGLPAKDDRQVYFTVWQPTSSGWTLAEAYYQHSAGTDLTICQIIATIDQSSQVHLLRKVPFRRTDADKPTISTWSPVDLADLDGDGQVEIILEGDAYEDHWLEVDSLKDGSPHTIFSGLGYYL
jgi:hypothetical protein